MTQDKGLKRSNTAITPGACMPTTKGRRYRTPGELVYRLLVAARGEWLYKSNLIMRAEFSPNRGNVYVRALVDAGFLDAKEFIEREQTVLLVTTSKRGEALLEEIEECYKKLTPVFNRIDELSR